MASAPLLSCFDTSGPPWHWRNPVKVNIAKSQGDVPCTYGAMAFGVVLCKYDANVHGVVLRHLSPCVTFLPPLPASVLHANMLPRLPSAHRPLDLEEAGCRPRPLVPPRPASLLCAAPPSPLVRRPRPPLARSGGRRSPHLRWSR
jgi:hypothetical protein